MELALSMSTSQMYGCLRKQFDDKYHVPCDDDTTPQLSRVLIDTG
jgi:hypothetical protein